MTTIIVDDILRNINTEDIIKSILCRLFKDIGFSKADNNKKKRKDSLCFC